jgi:hypothetical protein
LLVSFKGVSVLIVCGDEGIDLLTQLAWRREADAGQGLAGEDGEPDFDLIEPRSVGRGEVKMDVLVAHQPAIVFGLVGVQVVEADRISRRIVGDDGVYELRELDDGSPAQSATSAGRCGSSTPLRAFAARCRARRIVMEIGTAIGVVWTAATPWEVGPNPRLTHDRPR